MEIRALEAVRSELDVFAQDFESCIKTRPSRKHFARYLEGQLSSLPRKNAESIAELAGVRPATANSARRRRRRAGRLLTCSPL